jgi:tRNA(fMet)-specific endonuclease VapC
LTVSGKVLLDTNIVIGLFAGEKNITEAVSKSEEIFISSIVLGELYFGARKSMNFSGNASRIDEFALDNFILNCDDNTAKEYGRIKDGLRKKGTPIPENDIWIAASACQHHLTLVTRDAHFSEIDGLRTARWEK